MVYIEESKFLYYKVSFNLILKVWKVKKDIWIRVLILDLMKIDKMWKGKVYCIR